MTGFRWRRAAFSASLVLCGLAQRPPADVRVRQVNHDRLYDDSGRLRVAPAPAPPRFEPDDPQMLAHLDAHGYAVVAHAANASELEELHALLWDYLGRQGARRGDAASWSRLRLNPYGILWPGAQTELMWRARALSRVRAAFTAVWGTAALISSFESFSMFAPAGAAEAASRWRPVEAWFHTDQNSASRPGLQTIQGFVSLYDQPADGSRGSLLVVPGSHAQSHDAVCDRARQHSRAPDDAQFMMLAPNDPALLPPRPNTTGDASGAHAPPPLRRVACRRGDLVLWDSRVVHASHPPPLEPPPACALDRSCSREALEAIRARAAADAREFARVVLYTCQVPKAWAPRDVLATRALAFDQRGSCSHWPFRADCQRFPPEVAAAVRPPGSPELSAEQRSLIGLLDDDDEDDAAPAPPAWCDQEQCFGEVRRSVAGHARHQRIGDI